MEKFEMKKAMKKQGFTLVEIMIVVAIIGLLAAIGIPSFQKARANTLEKSALNNARLVISAVDQYAMEKGFATNTPTSFTDYSAYLKGNADDLQVGATAINQSYSPNGTESSAVLASNLYSAIFQ
jgi:type IV pilus assembly protein PilA